MKTALLLATALMAAAPAARSAEPASTSSPNAGAEPMRGTAVFERFHGKPGVDRIVADLIAHARTDPRIAEVFKGPDLARLQVQLSDQFCYLLGGGCAYGGKDMAKAHKDLGLQDADLNALVEDLQQAMDREGVPFPAQNALLAKLAPMRRTVVVR